MRSNSESRRPIVLAFVVLTVVGSAFSNTRPNTPVITQPGIDGEIANAEDVHMETGPFSDPDPDDIHLCTDWEIWTSTMSERVWAAECIGGVERVHAHLGDGVFLGSHAGRTGLMPDSEYLFRVRHRDDSGDPDTEWSLWAERLFGTGPISQVFPLLLDDIDLDPVPDWTDPTGVSIELPDSPEPPSMVVESAFGELLLSIAGAGVAGNEVLNPVGLPEHVAVRVRFDGGSTGLIISDSDLHFAHDGTQIGLYLPAVALGPGGSAVFWISRGGSSYVGSIDQTEPSFTALARGAPVPWEVMQPGFRVEVVATGFQLPVNIAFVPEPGSAPDSPMFYVTELYGTIRVVRRDGVVGTYASGLLNFNPTGDFPGSGVQGVSGIVVDPATGDVFAALLYDAAPPDGDHYPKVIRLQSEDGGYTAATITTVLDMPGETQGQSHQISNLTIGPDGKLYVHMGDGFDASTGLNLDSFRGKILRVNLDGTAPVDNPFYDAADGINARDYIFAYGFRNPFGGAWRSADQSHYEVENGPTVDRFARVDFGASYGWNGTDASMATRAIYNWSPAHAPVSLAWVQPSTFGGSGFPASKQDHVFVTESGPTWASGPQVRGKRITEFEVDAAGNLIDGPRDVIVYNGDGKATAVALAAGPDGLYFSDLYKDVGYSSPIDPGANILRIRYVGVAAFSADRTTGVAPLEVNFTDTSDLVGASAWHWDFGDGATSELRHPSHTYEQIGDYDVRLTVTTPAGLFVELRERFIRVTDAPRIAMLVGQDPPSTGDDAVAAFISSHGFDVAVFDDEPGNRPEAAALAQAYDGVVISSSCDPVNIGGEFRAVSVPLVFWNFGMLGAGRESLAESGGFATGVSIDVTTIAHPITAGLSTGPLPVYLVPAQLNVGAGMIGVGVDALAVLAGGAGSALLAAEAGAQLIDYSAPARRVFLFLDSGDFAFATPAAGDLLIRSILWSIDEPPPICLGDLDQDRDIDLADLATLLSHFGDPTASSSEGDIDSDGDVDITDLAVLLARFGTTCP